MPRCELSRKGCLVATTSWSAGGQIVWLAFSRDETVMGFAFPKEERNWLIGGSPDKFMLPDPSDLRYNWVLARLAALDEAEMRDLVLDAWRMVVPKRVAAAHAALPNH